MNKKQKILIILGLTLALVSVLLVSNQVWAQGAASTTQSNIDSSGTRISGIGESGLDVIFGFINQVFGSIGGTLYALAGGLANFSISLNFDILNNPMITTGWQITRDLANLGFVLFIIIIAIATILRMQQYGAKSTLGKLIAVALLVNFSLVFAGVFIDFSNMLTNFFIKNITSSGPGGLAVALSESFKIQNLLQVRGGEEANLFQGMFIGIASNIFVIALTFIGAFSLFALAVMFLVRVVALGLLLVLVPLACLSAILPATKKLWGQWSSSFIEWALFGPMASFFLYLAVFMATNYGKLMEQQALTAQGVGTRNEITFANLLIAQPLVQIGRMFLVIGFLLGGLIAANSMKTMGASTVMSGVNAFGKWARGTMGRMGAGIATRPLRGTWAQKQIENMQKAGLGGNKFVRAISRPLRTMGGALSAVGVEQGVKSVQQAEARLKNRFASDRSLALALPTLSHTDQIAAVKRLMKNKTMNLVDERALDLMIGNKDTENVFKRYGAGKEYEDFKKASGRSTAMFTGKDKEGNPITREEAMKQLFKSYVLKDFEGLRKKSITEDADAAARIKAIIDTNPGALAKLMPKFSGEDFDKFTGGLIEAVPEIIEKEKKDLKEKIKKGGEEATEAMEVIKGYLEHYYPAFSQSFNKNLANRIAGWGGEYAPPAETTT